MAFIPHSQEELKNFNIVAGETYSIEYPNKDYYKGILDNSFWRKSQHKDNDEKNDFSSKHARKHKSIWSR